MSTPNPPRENLVRALSEPPELVERSVGSNEPTIMRGHFAVWDTWTTIRSTWENNGKPFLERFAPTSMDKTINEGRNRMRVLFQHGRDHVTGDKPLGTIRGLEPDAFGARYEVELFDEARYVQDLIPGLRAGAYGASHRFTSEKEEYVKKPPLSDYNPNGVPERTITEARVMEFGPVTWGAYPTATSGIRCVSISDEYHLSPYLNDPEWLARFVADERKRHREPRVTVTYGKDVEMSVLSVTNTASTAAETEEARMEPEPSEATTPQQQNTEPEPSEATTREPGAHTPPRFNTREEWLEWISRI